MDQDTGKKYQRVNIQYILDIRNGQPVGIYTKMLNAGLLATNDEKPNSPQLRYHAIS